MGIRIDCEEIWRLSCRAESRGGRFGADRKFAPRAFYRYNFMPMWVALNPSRS